MNPKYFLLLFYLVAFHTFSLFSQSNNWQIAAKVINERGFNTQIFIQHDTSLNLQHAMLNYEIMIRPQGRHEQIVRSKKSVPTNRSAIYKPKFKLPNGLFDIEISIQDSNLNYLYEETIQFDSDHGPPSLKVTDIFLSYQLITQLSSNIPLLSPSIPSEANELFFAVEIKNNAQRELTARAVLFREISETLSDKATAFHSKQQINRVLNKNKRGELFADKFSLEKLTQGNYLIEVLIYEDDRLLLERSTEFSIDWKGKTRIFEDLETSVQMMMLGFPRLNQTHFQPLNRIEFEDWWRNQYGVDATLEMEQYFKRVFQADALYSHKIEGWKTDRGKIHIQYGEPDQILPKKVGNKEFQRWHYVEWNLSFIFEKKASGFALVR